MGARAELSRVYVDGHELDSSLQMRGGGIHSIGPGQVTDDSEMSMSLMWALIFVNKSIDADAEKVINFDTIAQFYVKWFRSKPFDIDYSVNYALDCYEYNMDVP